MCIEGSTGIEVAARRLALADAHHVVVVDSAGVAVGIVSVLDVLRAMLGIPAHHPEPFRTGTRRRSRRGPTNGRSIKRTHRKRLMVPASSSWSVGLIGEIDAVVWVEACANVRNRIETLTALASSGEPALARLLERHDLAVPRCSRTQRGGPRAHHVRAAQ